MFFDFSYNLFLSDLDGGYQGQFVITYHMKKGDNNLLYRIHQSYCPREYYVSYDTKVNYSQWENNNFDFFEPVDNLTYECFFDPPKSKKCIMQEKKKVKYRNRTLNFINNSVDSKFLSKTHNKILSCTGDQNKNVFFDNKLIAYNLFYKKTNSQPFESNLKIIQTFPNPRESNSYSEYQGKISEWMNAAKEICQRIILPMSISSLYYRVSLPRLSRTIKDFDSKLSQLGPANYLQLLDIVLSANSFNPDAKFNDQLTPNKPVLFKYHLTNEKKWYSQMVPLEPNPAFYDNFMCFQNAYNNWKVLINENLKPLPAHPRDFNKNLDQKFPFIHYENKIWNNDTDDASSNNNNVNKRKQCQNKGYQQKSFIEEHFNLTTEEFEKLKPTRHYLNLQILLQSPEIHHPYQTDKSKFVKTQSKDEFFIANMKEFGVSFESIKVLNYYEIGDDILITDTLTLKDIKNKNWGKCISILQNLESLQNYINVSLSLIHNNGASIQFSKFLINIIRHDSFHKIIEKLITISYDQVDKSIKQIKLFSDTLKLMLVSSGIKAKVIDPIDVKNSKSSKICNKHSVIVLKINRLYLMNILLDILSAPGCISSYVKVQSECRKSYEFLGKWMFENKEDVYNIIKSLESDSECQKVFFMIMNIPSINFHMSFLQCATFDLIITAVNKLPNKFILTIQHSDMIYALSMLSMSYESKSLGNIKEQTVELFETVLTYSLFNLQKISFRFKVVCTLYELCVLSNQSVFKKSIELLGKLIKLIYKPRNKLVLRNIFYKLCNKKIQDIENTVLSFASSANSILTIPDAPVDFAAYFVNSSMFIHIINKFLQSDDPKINFIIWQNLNSLAKFQNTIDYIFRDKSVSDSLDKFLKEDKNPTIIIDAINFFASVFQCTDFKDSTKDSLKKIMESLKIYMRKAKEISNQELLISIDKFEKNIKDKDLYNIYKSNNK